MEAPTLTSGFSCEHFYMVVQAALEHFGLALVPNFLCEDLLQKGTLVSPLNITLNSDFGYYLISPPHKKDERKVVEFKQWLREELSCFI